MTTQEAKDTAAQATADGWKVLEVAENAEYGHAVTMVSAHEPNVFYTLVEPGNYAFHRQRLADLGITSEDIRGGG